MMRRYNRWHLRFDQPDPYEGSYDLTNPQSLNRYAYVNNDPTNFIDPTGMQPKAGSGCTASDGQPGIVDGDGKCNPGVRETVTVYGTFNNPINPGLASLIYERIALDRAAQQGRTGDRTGARRRNPKPPLRHGPTVKLHRGDKWYGYNNKEFHKWFHRCWKESGDADATKEEIQEAYEEWVSRGKPTGGNCYGGKSPTPAPVPVPDPLRNARVHGEAVPAPPPLSAWERFNRWLDNNIPPPPKPPPIGAPPPFPIWVPLMP